MKKNQKHAEKKEQKKQKEREALSPQKSHPVLKAFFVVSMSLMIVTIAVISLKRAFEPKAELLSYERLGREVFEKRWYTAQQVALGEQVFTANCVVCHGIKGVGTLNWKQRLPDGNYPPPPLNGSAHTWHHSMDSLMSTLEKGGGQFGGVMPGFGETLSEAERLSAIAYIQSLWSNEIYAKWRAGAH